jgi:putative spermidine/putrescine transport system permease protein
MPAITLVIVSLAFPLAVVLKNSFTNDVAPSVLPRTTALLASWTPGQEVSVELQSAIAEELVNAEYMRQTSRLGSALDLERRGLGRLVKSTARLLYENRDQSVLLPLLIQSNLLDDGNMIALKRGVSTFSLTHIMRALDYSFDANGVLKHAGSDQAIFVDAIIRTVVISFVVTSICVVLAYPVAFLLSYGSSAVQRIALFCVLFPFWTSLLVRTSAWIVLLQRQGLVNDVLISLSLTTERLQLIHNRVGLLVTMIHILLPFMVLPVYASMKAIPREHLLAALSLGASPVTVFWRVALPQTVPGLRTGITLVFVLGLGFYVTPALVGGPGDQMLSSYIASYINERLDWSAGSALSLILILLLLSGYLLTHSLIRNKS